MGWILRGLTNVTPSGPSSHFHIDWGDVGTWTVGLGTTGALVAAVLGLRQQGRELRAALAESKQAEEFRQAEVARYVSAWPDEWDAHFCRGTCRNGSGEPVYSVRVDLTTSSGELGVVGKELPVLAPGEEKRFEFPEVEIGGEVPQIGLSFVDGAGRKWTRSWKGLLKAEAGLLEIDKEGQTRASVKKSR
jgi:hypothetical protein